MSPDKAIDRLRASPKDTEAWEAIYRSMQTELVPYVSSLLATFRLRTAETVHDVVHEALVAFWESWPNIKAGVPNAASATAYLRATCRNAIVDRYRHDRKAQPLLDFLTITSGDGESPMVRDILVGEVLTVLPSPCATLLRTFMDSGSTLAELADREGVPPSTFYTRWYRCLKKARDILQK